MAASENFFQPRPRTQAGLFPENTPVFNSNYLIPFHNTLYYFLLVPFKILINTDGQPVIKTIKIQQTGCAIICTISTILLLFFSVKSIFLLFTKASNDNTVILLVLEFFSNTFWLYISIITSKIVWTKQHVILQILKCTGISGTGDRSSHKKGLVVLITISSTLFMVAVPVSGVWINNVNAYNPFDVFGFEFRHKIGLFSKFCWNTILGYAGSVLVVSHGLILCVVLELNKTCNWLRAMTKFPGSKEKAIYLQVDTYRKIVNIIEVVNTHIFENLLISCCVASVTYLAQTPYIMLSNGDKLEKLSMPASLCALTVWIVVADFNYFVRNFYFYCTFSAEFEFKILLKHFIPVGKYFQVHRSISSWICSHYESAIHYDLNQTDLILINCICHEIWIRPVALQCKYFAVTYTFLGSVQRFDSPNKCIRSSTTKNY